MSDEQILGAGDPNDVRLDLPLRPDFSVDAVQIREDAIGHAFALRGALQGLLPLVSRQDDREAVADARDSLRGIFAALRDCGTNDPRGDDDPDGSRTVVTLGTVLPLSDQSAADRVRDLLAAQCCPGCGPKVTQYEDGSVLVDWPDGRAESFPGADAALASLEPDDPGAALVLDTKPGRVSHRHPGINHPSYFPTGNDGSGTARPVTCDGCGAAIGMLTPWRIAERMHVVDWHPEPVVCCDACRPQE